MIHSLKAPFNLTFVPPPVIDDITIVIPTLGRAILETCFYWIYSGSAWPASLIVVDQGSNNKVVSWIEMLRKAGIKVEHVPSSQRGRAAAVNRGLERVNTRFVVVTDDDCFVDFNWLTNMSRRLADNPMAIITGRVEPEGDEEVVAVMMSCSQAIYHRPRLKFDTMSGGNMGTSMAVIECVGMFDEDSRLRTAEDCEWAYRALRSGVPIIYTPEVSVRHYGWRDTKQRAAQYKAYARSHGAFYGKYLRKGDLFIVFRALLHYLRALRRWLSGIIKGNKEQAFRGRAYLTGLLPGILAGMRTELSHHE